RRLRVAEQQLISIGKALSTAHHRIIIMDEPTSALAHQEIEQLFAIIRKLKAEGVSFIYVSHHLTELFQIADRVSVMRDGQCVLTKPIGTLTKDEIARAMVGHDVETRVKIRDNRSAKTVLDVAGLSLGTTFRDLNFAVNEGETVGFTGLMGCGSLE